MKPSSLRMGWGLFILLVSLSATRADDLEDIRPAQEPKTAVEYWEAVQLELDVGRPDLAAAYLRGLLQKKFDEKDILSIVEKVGMTPILRLRRIPKWSDNEKTEKQARADAGELIRLAGEANRKKLGDAGRIRNLIKLLQASREERLYATQQIRESGAAAIPVLLESYLNSAEPEDRRSIRQVLGEMGPDTVPPLLAALDAPTTPVKYAFMKLDILEVLRTKQVRSFEMITPRLWFHSANPAENPDVRKKATNMLADFVNVPASRLPQAKVALTKEAETFYYNKAKFKDPNAIEIWRWEGTNITLGWTGTSTVTAKQAEEYYGLYYARQALNLDPEYRPAQLIALSLAVDKTMERVGVEKPLSTTAPTVAELLAKSNPELLIEVLEKAIKDKRTNVVLATVRELGARAEIQAKRPTGRGEGAVVQALRYPDQRVQFSAAEALLRIPGAPAPTTASLIVEILRKALTPVSAYIPGNKILVALGDVEWRTKVRQAVHTAGFEPVLASDSRSVMRELQKTSEVEAILVESRLPGSGLSNLLAQLRQDTFAARIPVFLAAVPESRTSVDALATYRTLKTRQEAILEGTGRYRVQLATINQEEQTKLLVEDQAFKRNLKEVFFRRNEMYDRHDEAVKEIKLRYTELRENLNRQYPTAVRVLAELPSLEAKLQTAMDRYDMESRIRENALRRYVQRFKDVEVVHTAVFSDAAELKSLLNLQKSISLSGAEKQKYADRAMELLSGLAEGRPAGYDIKPVISTMLTALESGKLSPEVQQAGIRAASRFQGKTTQTTLVAIIKDPARPPVLRSAATRALIVNIQIQSNLLPAGETTALGNLAKDKGTTGQFREDLFALVGTLRPSDKVTGEMLKTYNPKPVAPLPPPKK